MIPDVVLNYARQVAPTADPHNITLLTGGFSSQAYKIDTGGQPFVLLTQRPGAAGESRYAHASVVLRLLTRHGFKRAPEALWLDPKHQALALSFLEGTAADNFDFSTATFDTKQLALNVIDGLLDLTAISRQEYEQAAAEYGVAPLPAGTASESAVTYGTDWLVTVEASCPDEAILEWLKLRVPRAVIDAARFDRSATTSLFTHGDPSNPNILIKTDGDWLLIDWDSSKFENYTIPFIIAYTTHTTDFMKPYRADIITHAANRLQMPVAELTQQVQDYRRFNEVFDVNWAAMMMAKVAAGDAEGDIEEFRKIANYRMKLYEESFGSD
jgi:aminoglycoside phosphotransferase (APT) family kinase protein